VGLGFGIQNSQFPEVVAGDDNRAAFAWLGTTTPGDDQARVVNGRQRSQRYKTIARRGIDEVINQRNFAAVDQILGIPPMAEQLKTQRMHSPSLDHAFPGYTFSIDDIIAINHQMIAEGAKPKPWILNGAPFISKSFLDALGADGTQGIMTIASAGVFSTNKDLSAKIEAKGQVPQEYQFVPYSEIYVIAMALEQAASTDHQKVRDTIAGLDIQGGPAGSVYPCNCLRFDATGRSATSTALVEQWQEGKVQTILPVDVATAKAIWPQ